MGGDCLYPAKLLTECPEEGGDSIPPVLESPEGDDLLLATALSLLMVPVGEDLTPEMPTLP